MAAEEILQFALFKEVLKRRRRKKRKLNNGAAVGKTGDGEEEESDEASDNEDDVAEQAPLVKVVPTGKQLQPDKEKDSVWDDGTQDAMPVDDSPDATGTNAAVNPERYA